MLYKRAFRKEKEVVTFLIKARMAKLAWNFSIEPRPLPKQGDPVTSSKRQSWVVSSHH